jgi:hypothetical protein
MGRYDGKPFLKLLECYVLWVIGELPTENDQTLLAMTPKLREVYGRDGSWQDIVAGEMDFPANTPEHIKGLWVANLQRAQSLNAVAFAQSVVDNNFTN